MITLRDLLEIVSQNVVVNIFHSIDHRAIPETDWNQEWIVVLIRAPRKNELEVRVI